MRFKIARPAMEVVRERFGIGSDWTMALRFADFVFDAERRQLSQRGKPVHLQPRAFKLLEVLLEERPRAVAKSELMGRIWPDTVVEESNLKTTVSEVRAALGNAELIRTVHRYGYAFTGEASSDALAPPTFHLHGENMRIAISSDRAVIGRDPGCDVWIDSNDISRQHARISARDGAFTIEDLGSRNGTWVGERRIESPTELHDGDHIRVAGVTLIFRAPTTDESTKSIVTR